MVKNNNSEYKSMIFFWPLSIFEDVVLRKDPGAIPIGFTKLGYKVTLIVGKMESTKIPSSIKVIELDQNNLFLYELAKRFNNPKYIIKHEIFKHLISSIKESINAAKAFIKVDPSIILIEHADLSSIISVAIYKFLIVLKTKKFNEKRFFIKLDVNPDDIKKGFKSKGIGKFFFYFYNFRYFLIFDKVIVESPCAYNELIKLNFSQKLLKKMVVIPNGYVDKNISMVKPDRKKIILSVGRISFQKGFDILIKSFQKVHLIHNDWQLRIVGPIVDQEYYDYLKNIVNNYDLEKSVIFVGEKMGDDLENEYNNASIFCFLSRNESFGIVRSEAIAHGLPMITSEAGCGIVYEKYGSIIVPIENILKPAEAMKKLIENPKLREEIAKKQMNAIITFDEVAKRIDDLPKF